MTLILRLTIQKSTDASHQLYQRFEMFASGLPGFPALLTPSGFADFATGWR